MLTSTNQLKNLLFLFIFTFQTLWYTQASTWGKNPIFWETSSYINGLCLSFLIIIPTRLPASVQTRSVITPGNTQNITSCEASIAKPMDLFYSGKHEISWKDKQKQIDLHAKLISVWIEKQIQSLPCFSWSTSATTTTLHLPFLLADANCYKSWTQNIKDLVVNSITSLIPISLAQP